MATEEQTIVVEEGSSSEETEDESSLSDSEGDDIVCIPCPPPVSAPMSYPYYQYVRTSRKGTSSHGHRRQRDADGTHHKRHGKKHDHGRRDGSKHSDGQEEQATESQESRAKGHRRGNKGHDQHHGSEGHGRSGGHGHRRNGHRSKRGGRGHGHRRSGSCSSEDGSNVIRRRVNVNDFKPEEVKVTVSGDTVKVKAVNDGGEILRKFKITKDCDISKVRVSRSPCGVLRIMVPAKDEKAADTKVE